MQVRVIVTPHPTPELCLCHFETVRPCPLRIWRSRGRAIVSQKRTPRNLKAQSGHIPCVLSRSERRDLHKLQFHLFRTAIHVDASGQWDDVHPIEAILTRSASVLVLMPPTDDVSQSSELSPTNHFQMCNMLGTHVASFIVAVGICIVKFTIRVGENVQFPSKWTYTQSQVWLFCLTPHDLLCPLVCDPSPWVFLDAVIINLWRSRYRTIPVTRRISSGAVVVRRDWCASSSNEVGLVHRERLAAVANLDSFCGVEYSGVEYSICQPFETGLCNCSPLFVASSISSTCTMIMSTDRANTRLWGRVWCPANSRS